VAGKGKKAMTDIEKRARKIINEEIAAGEPFTLEDNFFEELGADSLDFVELIVAVEEEFGFEIPDEDAEELMTGKALVKYVGKRLKEMAEGKMQ
jgi:acyl carrier protein